MDVLLEIFSGRRTWKMSRIVRDFAGYCVLNLPKGRNNDIFRPLTNPRPFLGVTMRESMDVGVLGSTSDSEH
jgi:hypothetical protein